MTQIKLRNPHNTAQPNGLAHLDQAGERADSILVFGEGGAVTWRESSDRSDPQLTCSNPPVALLTVMN